MQDSPRKARIFSIKSPVPASCLGEDRSIVDEKNPRTPVRLTLQIVNRKSKIVNGLWGFAAEKRRVRSRLCLTRAGEWCIKGRTKPIIIELWHT